MKREDLLRKIEALANCDPNTLNGSENLEELDAWDSLAVLSIISLFDKEFKVVVPASKVNDAQTVDDVLSLVADQLDN